MMSPWHHYGVRKWLIFILFILNQSFFIVWYKWCHHDIIVKWYYYILAFPDWGYIQLMIIIHLNWSGASSYCQYLITYWRASASFRLTQFSFVCVGLSLHWGRGKLCFVLCLGALSRAHDASFSKILATALKWSREIAADGITVSPAPTRSNRGFHTAAALAYYILNPQRN